MSKELFRTDNTSGYATSELDALNAEWDEIVAELGLEENTDEYEAEAQKFSDAVARR